MSVRKLMARVAAVAVASSGAVTEVEAAAAVLLQASLSGDG